MKYFVFLFFAATAWSTPYDSYFAQAGCSFGIDEGLLKRIATIESSMNPRAINLNKNGTRDIGLMQINSMHLKRLSKIGVTENSLLDPEVNIYVASLLLSSHIRKRGYNLNAIGCYHSANPVYKNQWLKRLAMATIPEGSTAVLSAAKQEVIVEGDPRSRFAQAQIVSRTDEKIAQGITPKNAWRQAKAEVNQLMGYTN